MSNVKFKQIGQNLTLTLPGQDSITLRVENKTERDEIKANIVEMAAKFEKTQSEKTKKTLSNKMKKILTADDAGLSKKAAKKKSIVKAKKTTTEKKKAVEGKSSKTPMSRSKSGRSYAGEY